MTIKSGLLLFRKLDQKVQIFLVHPGGPIWSKRDLGAWSIPKGSLDHGELAADAAIREFKEETGHNPKVNKSQLIDLGHIPYFSNIMYCFALEQDIGEIKVVSNLFDLEWPPKSGNMQQFSEMDRGGYFDLNTARLKLNLKQVAFIDKLEEYLALDFGQREPFRQNS